MEIAVSTQHSKTHVDTIPLLWGQRKTQRECPAILRPLPVWFPEKISKRVYLAFIESQGAIFTFALSRLMALHHRTNRVRILTGQPEAPQGRPQRFGLISNIYCNSCRGLPKKKHSIQERHAERTTAIWVTACFLSVSLPIAP